MTISISSYVDPGVYIQEVIVPGGISTTSERNLAIVGIAPRTRRTLDETVIRGAIYDEALTVAAVSPHTATLINVSNRDRNFAKLYMNGNELGLGDWAFLAASLTGLVWGVATLDVSPAGTQYFTLSFDGRKVVTIDMNAAVLGSGGIPAAATPAAICAAINWDLGNAAGGHFLLYGVTYNSVATFIGAGVTAIITLTSPILTSASDLKILQPQLVATDAAPPISGGAWVPIPLIGVQAPTMMVIQDTSYSATADYNLDYVAIDLTLDTLLNADATNPLDNIVRVGSYPGGSSYVKDSDYEEATNDIEWSTAFWTMANVVGINGPFNIIAGTNDQLRVSINGKTPYTMVLAPGGALTAAAIATNINDLLDDPAFGGTIYGPEYSHVASVVGVAVLLTAPSPYENFPQQRGYSQTIEFLDVADNAFATIFGAITLPYEVRGTGVRPAFATGYYTTYDYTRPAADYTEAHRMYDPDQLYEYCSSLTLANYINNQLCVAGKIAFENGVSSIYLAQANDVTTPGSASLNQIYAAIDVCKEKKAITDVVVLDTRRESAVYLMEHVSDQCSMIEKHYRRGWYGMARDTDIGDPDTEGTLVYRSTRTLQPGGTSPGRGRHFLLAPPNAMRTITIDTGQEIDLELDGSFVAVAAAAKYAALPSPSSALLGKNLLGFNEDGFTTYLRGERYTLADKGVMVVTLDAGRFTLLDPLSTEAGGGKVVQFEEPASSAQKDAVTNTVDNLIDANCKGVVPDDLADFISDIKKWILLGIEADIEMGNIGPYKDEFGFPREIDPTTDIKVYQSTTDPRNFYFKYWYNLRYPAMRFFGEYSVDNPFFGSA